MKNMMKKIISVSLCAVVAISLVACGGGKTEEAAPTTTDSATPAAAEADTPQEGIVWNFVSAFTKEAAEHTGFWIFFDRINEELDGRLNIEYLGGTEIVEYFQQYESLGQGVFDIGHIPVNMLENIVPESNALYLTELNPMEMRANGTYDYVSQFYESKGNTKFLGVTSGEKYGYTLYTNFEVPTLDAFKGKTIRTAPVFVPLLQALGAGSSAIGGGEVYQALERGVVDGAGWSTLGAVDYSWYEVVKYRIDPIFYPCNIGMYVNLDSFNALPADLQEEVLRIAAEVEEETFGIVGDMVDEEFKTLEEKGMETIVLEGDMKEDWLAKAHDAGWENLKTLAPDSADKLQELVTK